ncbi:MAG: 50S ribosomal protein L17 [Candidatus Zapsychrus exili]|nr:50S ribosomal protein L17 [Candidatus Zapsychrus exili]
MRHRIAGNTLNRKTSHRKATVRDIAKAAIIKQRISTTKAKAKEARKLVDKLITLGKKGTLADKRRAFAILCDHKIVSQLFTEIAPRFQTRKGGYTRIIPLANRRGDNAEMVYLELTEKKEIVIVPKKKKKAAIATKPESSKTTDDKAKVEPKETEDAQEEIKEVKKDDSKNKDKPSSVPRDKPKSGKFPSFKKIFNRKSSGDK